tara:strand:+ start:863 stop:2185 length:1323 start_codon:yes stop_codon:yes gene_type:complete
MADIVSPISSPTPPQIPGNVSTLVSPDILANLKTSEKPKSFGDQLLKAGLAAGANAALNSTIARLYKEKALLIQEGIELDINHQKKLLELQKQNTPAKKVVNGQVQDIPPQLNDEEYNKEVIIEDANYKVAQINLQERKDKNQKDIDDYLKDPFAKQKEKIKKRKEARTKLKNRTKKEKQDSRKQKRKAVLKNIKKTIVPILTLLLTDKIAEIISQNDVIKELVDKTNAIIEDANASNDPTKLENAKIVRDNAIRVIQSNEDKIIKINDQIQKITIYITIFSTIIAILTAIPIPTAVPPGVGIPVNVITKIVVILEKANKIVLALSALLSIITVSLEKAIQILEELKAQLLPINGELELKLPPTPVAFGTSDFPEYKGFKFALREENNPKFEVRGNKRHYAVAINKQNIEQLKSDSSFTLDPNDLIEQLKLVIDQQNLQG